MAIQNKKGLLWLLIMIMSLLTGCNQISDREALAKCEEQYSKATCYNILNF